jgi:IS5 family transposase
MPSKWESLLAEMEVVLPLKALLTLIGPHYPKTGAKGARHPYPLEIMLRIYLVQKWYDPG